MTCIEIHKGCGEKKKPGSRFSLILILAFLFFTACPSLAYSVDREIVDRIVAIVNDELITYSQLTEAFKPFEKKIRERNYSLEQEMEIRFRIRSNLIQQMIDQKLTDQEMTKAKITVSEAEVSGYIERIKQVNSFTDEDLRQQLGKEGVSFEQYTKEIRNLLLRNKLIQYQIKSRIVITPEEIEAYYDDHKDEFGEKTLEDVSLLIQDKLYQVQADERFAKWISDLREDAQIKIIQ